MAVSFSTANPLQDSQALVLARLAAGATLGDQLTLSSAFSAAEQTGYSPDAIYESLLTLLPYIGYPKTIHALISFQHFYPTFLPARGPAPTEPWNSHAAIVWPDRGAEVFRQLWGAGALQKSRLDELSPELADWIVSDTFGRIFARPGLSLVEREALVIGCLLAQGAVKEIGTHRRALLHLGGHDGILDVIFEDLRPLLPPGVYVLATDALARMRGLLA